MPDDLDPDLVTRAATPPARHPGPAPARRARYVLAAVALAVAALATSACVALMGRKLTPEEQVCRDAAVRGGYPDVAGTWETRGGKQRFNLRRDPQNRRAVIIAAAADSPEPPPWTVSSAGLAYPSNPVCGGPFEIAVRREVPRASGFTETELLKGQLDTAGDQLRIAFSTGEVWVRTGDAGADAVVAVTPATPGSAPATMPSPGVETRGVKLTGPTLTVINVEDRNALRHCQRACDDRWDCKGWTLDHRFDQGNPCELKAAVTGVEPAEPDVYAWVRGERVAAVPAPETYAENTDLTGANLSVTKLGWKGLSGCHDLCKANEACRAFVWSEATTACTLKRTVGEARVAEGLTAFAMKPPLVPPAQTLTSPLCAAPDHQAEPVIYGLTTQWLSRTEPATGNEIYFKGEGPYLTTTADPATGPAYRLATQVADPAYLLPFYDGTRLFTVRPVPGKGTVHIHSYVQPELVLKRAGGKVVMGPVDAASEWRIENLWEHLDPPATGVWYVIRSALDGAFLGTDGEGVALYGSPADAGTHWRFQRFGGTDAPLPVQEPEPIKLDPVVVDKLAAWSLKEYIRQDQPACWKQRLNDGCPAAGQTTSCGAFCAQTTGQCVLDVVTMVESVTEVAASVAGLVFTGGTANVALKAATTAAKTGGKATAKVALKQAMKSGGRALAKKLSKRTGARVLAYMKSRGKTESFKRLAKSMAKDFAVRATGRLVVGTAQVGAEAYGAVEQERAEQQLLEAYVEEASRRAAERLALKAAAGDDPDLLEIAAMVDPTGVAGVVNAFVKPMCVETPWPDLGP